MAPVLTSCGLYDGVSEGPLGTGTLPGNAIHAIDLDEPLREPLQLVLLMGFQGHQATTYVSVDVLGPDEAPVQARKTQLISHGYASNEEWDFIHELAFHPLRSGVHHVLARTDARPTRVPLVVRCRFQ
jgi:hypothetical protein